MCMSCSKKSVSKGYFVYQTWKQGYIYIPVSRNGVNAKSTLSSCFQIMFREENFNDRNSFSSFLPVFTQSAPKKSQQIILNFNKFRELDS